MNNSDFSVNPEVVIAKLSSRIADLSLQVAMLESLIESLKSQILESEENGLT